MTKSTDTGNEVRFKNTVILKNENSIVVKSKSNYIKHQEFIDVFTEVREMIKHKPVEKVIFDKSNLTVFNQESMKWYYLQWKPEMLNLGLKKHYKILPEDQAFVKLVNLCKEKIYEKMPQEQLTQMDIRYCKSLEEATKK